MPARRGLSGDSSGQITLSMALLALPLCLAAGSALDYGMLLRARAGLQLALDSATLAATAKLDGKLDPAAARSYFVLNGSLEGVQLHELKFTQLSTSSMQGTLTASVPSVFMRIIRTKDYTVRLKSVTASKPVTYATGTFAVTAAKGEYDKDVYHMVKNTAGVITKSSLFATYDYFFDAKAKKWVSSLKIVNQNPPPIVKGEAHFFKMVVFKDPLLQGRRVNPDEMSRNDPETRNFLRIEGSCQGTGKITYSWEETRNPLGDYNDIVTEIRCAAQRYGAVGVRLSQ